MEINRCWIKTWTSNTDLLPNLGVSDIAIDPSNSDVMFIATGDRDAGDTYSYGIMKSQDGGLNWDSTGLSFSFVQSYRGNRILINPSNTDQIIVSTRRAMEPVKFIVQLMEEIILIYNFRRI